jgi:heavy metal sensor kinase
MGPFFRMSIRSRLTLWYTLVVLGTLLLFGGVSYYYTGQKLTENLDLSLQNEVRWVKEFIGPQASRVRPSKRSIDAMMRNRAAQPGRPGGLERDTTVEEEADEIWNAIYRHNIQSRKRTYIQFLDRKGAIIYRSYNLSSDSLVVRDSIPLNFPVVLTGRMTEEPVRVAAIRDANFTYLVGYPLAELRDLQDNLYLTFLILIPIAVVISLVGGYMLAKSSLRPVDDIVTQARKISAENLEMTIPVRNPRDEIGRLGTTINEMTTRLHESFAQVRQFSADASHELRTPLTIMRGEIELALRSTKTPDEYRSVLESALEEIMRMTAIIDNLLVLAKADQGRYHSDLSEVDLGTLMRELYEDTEVLALRKDIHVALSETKDICIVGDRLRLRQLFLNLIDNAIKYTPQGGSVTLSLGQDNGNARIAVSDTGIGIPREEQSKIFDRFYRVDKARSRDLGGSGLGLSIAKWIAELHRGTITVSSAPHEGSTFTVLLPLN